MTNTGFFTRATDRLATGYLPSNEGLEVYDEADGIYSHSPIFEDGGAGLVSTVDDLYAFSQFLRHDGHGTIDRSLVAQMTSDQLTPDQKIDGTSGEDFFIDRSWGYCVAVVHDGSWGWGGGLGSSFWIHPELDLTVIVLTQRMWESPDLPAAHRDIRAAALEVFS